MFTEIFILLAGVLPGRLLSKNKMVVKMAAHATMITIYALLFSMGGAIGANNKLFSILHLIGVQALLISLCCTLGSVICVRLAQSFILSQTTQPDSSDNIVKKVKNPKKSIASLFSSMKGSLYILGFFILGMVLTRYSLLPIWAYSSNAALYILWAMLFCIGLGIGFDLNALLLVRELGLRIALVPLLAIVGTAIGGMAACLILPDFSLRSILAVGSGFGYYSLSSVIITKMSGAALGSIALLANIIRELFTLLATPLLVRLFGPLAPIAAAGAPGMDTCLPIIVRFAGERYTVISIFSGFIFTALVPITVPLTLTLFN